LNKFKSKGIIFEAKSVWKNASEDKDNSNIAADVVPLVMEWI